MYTDLCNGVCVCVYLSNAMRIPRKSSKSLIVILSFSNKLRKKKVKVTSDANSIETTHTFNPCI